MPSAQRHIQYFKKAKEEPMPFNTLKIDNIKLNDYFMTEDMIFIL